MYHKVHAEAVQKERPAWLFTLMLSLSQGRRWSWVMDNLQTNTDSVWPSPISQQTFLARNYVQRVIGDGHFDAFWPVMSTVLGALCRIPMFNVIILSLPFCRCRWLNLLVKVWTDKCCRILRKTPVRNRSAKTNIASCYWNTLYWRDAKLVNNSQKSLKSRQWQIQVLNSSDVQN